jgi:hypothetical protein
MNKLANTVDYTKLFWLHDPFTRGIIRLEVQNEWVDIPKAWAIFRGEYIPYEPIIFRQFMGKRIADFLWSGLIAPFCVSKKVIDVLSSHNFVGWSTYTAEVYDKKGNQLLGYSGFVIKSHTGSQDLTRSQRITKPPIVPKGKSFDVYKGMYFDESKWDGSDIFLVDNGFIGVTKEVRDALIAEKINNIGLVPLSEFEIDVSTIEIGKNN